MASRNITVYNTTAYRLTAEEMATLQVLHLWFFISSELCHTQYVIQKEL